MPRQLQPQAAFLLWNQRGETFYNLAPLNAAFNQPHVSRGLAVADYDQDGDMDVLIADLGAMRQYAPRGQSGVALRLPPHSKVPQAIERPVTFWRAPAEFRERE